MSYIITPDWDKLPLIAVVGCGGTGGFVAEGLCRILIDSPLEVILIDPDRVEPHNLRRQTFYEGDIGKFKSQVLAERLSRQYGRQIAYSVFPYEKDIFDHSMGGGMTSISNLCLLIIGCVDNPQARRQIADSMGNRRFQKNWWIDSGNGYHSGQVLIGNTNDPEELNEAFDINAHTVEKLPSPCLQLPFLLIPPSIPEEQQPDCAEAVAADDQSPIINQAMATLVLDFIHRLLTNKLTSMGAYIDLDAGTLSTVPADPATVARMCSIKVNTLMANKCALGARYHL